MLKQIYQIDIWSINYLEKCIIKVAEYSQFKGEFLYGNKESIILMLVKEHNRCENYLKQMCIVSSNWLQIDVITKYCYVPISLRGWSQRLSMIMKNTLFY